jgi:hemerythrin superfamily protein
MKATDLLKEQHREVADLFQQIAQAEDPDEKGYLFDEMSRKLVAHDVIERAIFYPACEEKMGLTDLLGEAITEHGVVEFCLHVAGETLGTRAFDFKLTVLREMVEHHVKEEEKELFPAVEKALTARRLGELGVAMQERFEIARQANPGALVRANLREALGEGLEPVTTGSHGTKKGAQSVARIALKSPAKTARSVP